MVLPEPPTRQTYFTTQNTSEFIGTSSWNTIPNLLINLSTQTGDSLELSFTGRISWMDSAASGNIQAFLVFVIDGVQISEQFYFFNEYTSDGLYCHAIAYRYLATGLSPGDHNITMQIQAVGGFDAYGIDTMVLSALII